MTASDVIDEVLGDLIPWTELREALAAGDIGVWSWDLTTDELSADDTARRLCALPGGGELLAARWLEAIDPTNADSAKAFASAARNGEEPGHLVLTFRDAGGETRWTHLRARRSSGTRARLVGVAIDVTERMLVEGALNATEARLHRAQELGGALAFEWDARSDTVVASPAFKALYEVAPGDPMKLATLLSRIHPQDRFRVEEDLYRLLEFPARYEAELSVVLPSGTVRCILARGETIRDEAGVPSGIAGISMDITARKAAEEELKRSKREARNRFRELRALYQNAPVGLAVLDLDMRFARVNAFLTDLTDLHAEEHVGRLLFEVFPDLRERLEPVLRQVVDTRQPIRNVEVEGATPGQPDKKVWWRMHVYYMSDDYGATPAIGLVAEDVTAQKAAEQTRDLLSRELSHRIKNLFAVVASMVSLSARGNNALMEFARTVRGRIEALGRAHDYVRPIEWGGGSEPRERTLQGLLNGLLEPYRNPEQGAQVNISGDDPAIGPLAATALALSIHEFATNATKYGALSASGGKVEITCGGTPAEFTLDWAESGGPPVGRAPEREGFGTLLARRSVSHDLGGTITADWARDGLKIRIAVPLERLRS